MAISFDNLYPQLTDFGNLHLAWRKAARGKRGNPAAASFETNLADELIRLQDELTTETWQPGAYHSFTIRDPKQRLVSAAPFRDRVVHHALNNVTETIFENTFIADSYANRLGKGTHAALDKAQSLMRRFPYVLQCDIRQYFPSVDHAVLEAILFRKIADEPTRRLMQKIIRSGEGIHDGDYRTVYFPGDDLFAVNRPRGLPIGNLTSQCWANVYLNELDQFVKRQLHCKGYVRYVDDFLLFADDKPQLWAWKTAIVEFLNHLRLVLHEKSSTVYPVANGIPYLGFRLYPGYRLLKRKNGVNFQRRLKRYYRAYARGELGRDALNQRVRGWIAHVAYADTWGLRRSLFAMPIPKRQDA
ncbi:MAG: reverse transcriptase domain-containing protein [Proteobacteria bacterium]|nr:reverse transcriptase domain-containing protein [Pseudomonadota bacterium]